MALNASELSDGIIVALVGTHAAPEGKLVQSLNEMLRDVLPPDAPVRSIADTRMLRALVTPLADVIAEKVVEHLQAHARAKLPSVPVRSRSGQLSTDAMNLEIE